MSKKFAKPKVSERSRVLVEYQALLTKGVEDRRFIRDFLAACDCASVLNLKTADLKLLVADLKARKAEREAKDRIPKADPELFPGTKLSLTPADATKEQVGGNHYKQFELQPAEISHRNKLTFLEGSVVKRMHRHSRGGKGIQDLKKAIHEIRLIAKFDYNEDI